MNVKEHYLGGHSIRPPAITHETTISQLIDHTFLAYNAARLREACHLMVQKVLEPDVTVGLSITGALTPAGIGMAALIPLIECGFVDWIVSTGANLYHDAHFAIGHELHVGSANLDDRELREAGVVRIFDILFDYHVLLDTDAFFRETLKSEVFQHRMGTAELHHHFGRFLNERETSLGIEKSSFLAAAYRAEVPVYTSSPGDSSIGMNVAALALAGRGPRIDVSRDVNETAAIVYEAKRRGKSAVVILGGGSPKNFMLQTEPQIQEVLGLDEVGHDYFLQITDARPDTGGLSGATPAEAVSWGKVDPAKLPDAVVCYVDSTIGLPLLTAYAMANHAPRKLRRLYTRRNELHDQLRDAYLEKEADDGNPRPW